MKQVEEALKAPFTVVCKTQVWSFKVPLTFPRACAPLPGLRPVMVPSRATVRPKNNPETGGPKYRARAPHCAMESTIALAEPLEADAPSVPAPTLADPEAGPAPTVPKVTTASGGLEGVG